MVPIGRNQSEEQHSLPLRLLIVLAVWPFSCWQKILWPRANPNTALRPPNNFVTTLYFCLLFDLSGSEGNWDVISNFRRVESDVTKYFICEVCGFGALISQK
uniref:Uncharacterized protein n=1 Tax=Rhizophagus irregularis (strain DAOM 181602 / DAOM 197198 / MUCL 43194) TaxID=747089 RepID=U9T9U8_RHIID